MAPCSVSGTGSQIHEITGKRVTIAAFPLNWIKADGPMICLVAIEGLE